MDAPLLSLSLGASCVFLLGGADREAPVLPILLRSGDVSVLAGPARRFFHGVPKILPGSCPAHLQDILGSSRININIRQVT
jgi:alkylated DNA repair protein alkB family protein 1